MQKPRTIFRVLMPLALLMGTTLTASAAGAGPTTTARTPVEAHARGTLSAAPHVAAAVASCPITVGGHLGAMLCDTVMQSYVWPDGRLEYFVVGTTATNNIYHIYQLPSDHSVWSNWTQLPGNGVAVDGILAASFDPIIVEVLGTTGLNYCNHPQSGSPGGWSGWSSC